MADSATLNLSGPDLNRVFSLIRIKNACIAVNIFI